MAHHVLVGGGTGFIGKALCTYLKGHSCDVTVVSRMPGPKHVSWLQLEQFGLPEGITAVVNVAGQNVLDPTRRWTPGFKQNVYSSRINTSKCLAKCINNAKTKPKVFIGITGVSSYPLNTDKPVSENFDKPEKRNFDFMNHLCAEWEHALKLPPDSPTRQIILRTGVVLGRDGGMIKQLILPFWLGLGGPVGRGTQPLPWIHIEDLTSLIWFCIQEEKLSGIVNAVSPHVITNNDFTQEFAKALYRPAFIPVPESLLNLIFNEERASLLTTGPKVEPKRAPE
ncbi:epimerase family protein SDR39U1, partial [Ctenocephalides felis]|uniref:epimerase family protein SDR39U1 n=1 Tax=Ctenocephalides felis TaxID=7515 RepID=UPI000E6E1F1C